MDLLNKIIPYHDYETNEMHLLSAFKMYYLKSNLNTTIRLVLLISQSFLINYDLLYSLPITKFLFVVCRKRTES